MHSFGMDFPAAVEGQVGTARTASAGELAVVIEDAVSQTP